jgi:hypothetical protein
MENKTLNIYGTTVKIQKYSLEEKLEKEIEIQGLEGRQDSYLVVTYDEVSEERLKRIKGKYYGQGTVFEDDQVTGCVDVFAEDVDDKQMANILISEGARHADVYLLTDEEVKVVEKKKPRRKKAAPKPVEKEEQEEVAEEKE